MPQRGGQGISDVSQQAQGPGQSQREVIRAATTEPQSQWPLSVGHEVARAITTEPQNLLPLGTGQGSLTALPEVQWTIRQEQGSQGAMPQRQWPLGTSQGSGQRQWPLGVGQGPDGAMPQGQWRLSVEQGLQSLLHGQQLLARQLNECQQTQNHLLQLIKQLQQMTYNQPAQYQQNFQNHR